MTDNTKAQLEYIGSWFKRLNALLADKHNYTIFEYAYKLDTLLAEMKGFCLSNNIDFDVTENGIKLG